CTAWALVAEPVGPYARELRHPALLELREPTGVRPLPDPLAGDAQVRGGLLLAHPLTSHAHPPLSHPPPLRIARSPRPPWALAAQRTAAAGPLPDLAPERGERPPPPGAHLAPEPPPQLVERVPGLAGRARPARGAVRQALRQVGRGDVADPAAGTAAQEVPGV